MARKYRSTYRATVTWLEQCAHRMLQAESARSVAAMALARLSGSDGGAYLVEGRAHAEHHVRVEDDDRRVVLEAAQHPCMMQDAT